MNWQQVLSSLSGGVSFAGALYKTYTAYNEARASQLRADAQRAALNAQAVVSDNNAQLAEWQADDALARGQVSENAVRLKAAATKGSQIASFAARGIALDEGSALRVITETDVLSEIDANTAKQNAAKEAWADEQSAQSSRNNAALQRFGVVSPGQSTGGAIVGSALSGAATLSQQWYVNSKGN